MRRLCGGEVVSCLVRSSPERAVWVRALAGDIVLCSWARHFTLTVPLSTLVYKWVPLNLMLGVTLRWTSIPSGQGGVEIFLVALPFVTVEIANPYLFVDSDQLVS